MFVHGLVKRRSDQSSLSRRRKGPSYDSTSDCGNKRMSTTVYIGMLNDIKLDLTRTQAKNAMSTVRKNNLDVFANLTKAQATTMK